MARSFAFATAMAVMLASTGFGADELPKQESDDSFEVEPPLLIPYRDPETPGGAVAAAATPTPVVDLERLTRDAERARRSAIGAEHLYRMGALAKVEAEQRALKAVRLQADLEAARLAQAKAEMVTQDETRDVAQVSKTETGPAEVALARAIEAAHAAANKREEAELQAAEINLARQQKLLSLGSGRKSEVAKAERKLAELKAARN
jgi:hypothetical protein